MAAPKLDWHALLPDALRAIVERDVHKDLPWLEIEVLGNSLDTYIITAVTFVMMWALLFAVYRYALLRVTKLGRSYPDTAWAFAYSLARQIKPYIVPLIALDVAMRHLKLPPVWDKAFNLIVVALLTVQVVRLAGELARYLIDRSRRGVRPNDPVVQNTNRNLTVLVRTALWAAGLLFFLENAGYNISTLIAGLGISGVAIALATQAMLGDAFSSFAIALDKPFEIGDAIAVDNFSGTVEHIGLRTTRIRSDTGELLIFGNSDLSRSRIRNYKKLQRRMTQLKLAVHPGTPQDKLRRLSGLLSAAVTAEGEVKLDHANLVKIGETALIYEIVYFLQNTDYTLYLKTQESVCLTILATCAKEDIRVCFQAPEPFKLST